MSSTEKFQTPDLSKYQEGVGIPTIRVWFGLTDAAKRNQVDVAGISLFKLVEEIEGFGEETMRSPKRGIVSSIREKQLEAFKRRLGKIVLRLANVGRSVDNEVMEDVGENPLPPTHVVVTIKDEQECASLREAGIYETPYVYQDGDLPLAECAFMVLANERRERGIPDPISVTGLPTFGVKTRAEKAKEKNDVASG